MGYARSSLGLGGTHDSLSAVGGKDDQGILRIYEKFDALKDKWEFGQSMIVGRIQPGVCAIDPQTLYVFCGYKGNALDTVEKYSKAKGWISLNAILNYPAYNIAATMYGRDILIFGGYCAQKNDEPQRIMTMFKIQENKFVEVSDCGSTPLYMGTRSYIVRGRNVFAGFQIKDKQHIYYYNSDYWKSLYFK